MTIRCNNCGGPVRIIDDNGVTSPKEGDRWEKYECEDCGHTQTKVLKS